MAEQLIRNEQVVSSILTTSSIPQSLMYQGVAAFLCLKKIGPKTGQKSICSKFVPNGSNTQEKHFHIVKEKVGEQSGLLSAVLFPNFQCPHFYPARQSSFFFPKNRSSSIWDAASSAVLI